MSEWSAADIPDQTDRTFIVTGANSGLGEQTARALAAAGASVILACRNTTKAQAVADDIGNLASVAPLDLADLSSVRDFAESFGGADVLVNNAGVMAPPLRRTADGFEMQMGTNHLGHFALTGLILPRIRERVVTVSSGMHHAGRLDLDDINWQRRQYRRWRAYGDSKLANLMFGKDLADRLAAAGSPASSFVVHPGFASSELGQNEATGDLLFRLGASLPIAQSAADGALPTLFAATSPDAVNGTYYGPTKLFGTRGAPGACGFSRRADDTTVRRGLWDLSEQLTGVRFEI
ncbi:oxidoreductase [Gordonia sp. NPDC003429]